MIRPTKTTRRPARPAVAVRPRRAAPRTTDRRTTDHGRRGFTLVELLVVIVILAILMALLLPAINGAMRTARSAAVSSEINQLAQALAQFNTQYGGYPPSRVLLVENGNYAPFIGSNASITSLLPASPTPGWTTSSGTGDITVGQLASRSVSALRKFWPKVQISTDGNSAAEYRQQQRQLLVRLQRQRRPGCRLHPPGARMPGLLPGRHPAAQPDHPRRSHVGDVRRDGLRHGPDQPVQ